ncbi:MAG: ABC transporter permease subunit [Acidimicrobiales bacterium]
MKRALRSEWIKFSTARANFVVVVVGIVVTLALAALTASLLKLGPVASPGTALQSTTNPFLLYFLLILGVQSFTQEYRFGTMRITLTATPRRMEVFWSKLIILAIVGAVAAVVYLAISFPMTMAILSHRGLPTAHFADHQVRQALWGYVAVCAIGAALGAGVGALIRSTALAVTLVLVWPLVVEQTLASVLPKSIARHLPFQGAQAAVQLPTAGYLHHWAGLATFAFFAAIVVYLALVRFARSDA